jgi:hypothetical protein
MSRNYKGHRWPETVAAPAVAALLAYGATSALAQDNERLDVVWSARGSRGPDWDPRHEAAVEAGTPNDVSAEAM